MDGASYWQIFRRVMLPMGIPAIVTVAVLQFIQVWDDLLIGLLFLQSPNVRTITVGLATLQTVADGRRPGADGRLDSSAPCRRSSSTSSSSGTSCPD